MFIFIPFYKLPIINITGCNEITDCSISDMAKVVKRGKRKSQQTPDKQIKEENKENYPGPDLRRSKRIKREIKYEAASASGSDTEYKIEKEDEPDDMDISDKVDVKSSGRGTSRGSKYSKKAKTTLIRGVKSVYCKEDIVSIKYNDAVPVDIECPLKISHKVAKSSHGEYYDAMLNQTNIASNNNKYYILQILEKRQSDTIPPIAVWFRWGRVGHINGTMLKEYKQGELDDAINDFAKKFYDKTRNDWDEREEFIKCANKYDLVLRDYDEEINEEELNENEDIKIEPCELDEAVQELMKMISDINMMENCVKEMKYDINKAPLGK